MELLAILKAGALKGCSDIHLVIGNPPMGRVDGEIKPLEGFPVLDANASKEMIFGLLSDVQRSRFESEWELDFSIAVEGVARFRANILIQKAGIEAVFRIIASKIPTPAEIQLPPVITELAEAPRGLILVTGPTGSGKSTTLACLLNMINEKRHGHILTIEDPIEFVYENKNCVVRQREIGQHTKSFGAALRHALREDPDVVLIGEMRDLETISAALTMAETGHLVLGTLHTTDAVQTIDRIIDVFPAHQQQQVRTQLAGVLKTVVCQALIPKIGGKGRIAAREIMVVTPAISNMIREGKNHQIYGAIDTGARVGMTSLDKVLADLVRKGLISMDDALSKASHPETLKPGSGATAHG